MKRLAVAASLLAGLAVSFPGVLSAGSQGAPFTGTWEMNSSKSQASDARSTTLTIQEIGDKIKIASNTKKGDSVVTTEFTCAPNGKECEFDEGGHKSKISLYFNGPVLVAFKTDGPDSDSASQWNLQVSPDGKVLTVAITHILPAGKDETLVFDKKAGQ
jgi:hypothetical protein